MATTKDSNKLTIYKGKQEEYAFIPLDVSEVTSYNFTNGIIRNDGSTYIKNIPSDTDLYKLVNDNIIDASAIRDTQEDLQNPTISINSETYNINGYLSNDMLTHIIKLYYIENFKYTLDASQYTVGDDENTNVVNRGNTYMFTIIPKLTKDVTVLEASQMPVEPGGGSGGGSGSGGGGTGPGETEEPNKKYDIVFSVDENQTLSLVRQGATNNYKLEGTLIIKYKQSDNSIKGDTGVNNVHTTVSPILSITINNITKLFQFVKKNDGYNESTQLWEGEIVLNISNYGQTYELTPGGTYPCSTYIVLNKTLIPIFTSYGNRVDKYIGEGYQEVNEQNGYTFKLKNMFVPNNATLKAYFLQSKIGDYGAWKHTVMNVMKTNNLFGSKVSGIFIIVSDDKFLSKTTINSRTTTSTPSYKIGDFKVSTTGHNSIFTSSLTNNDNDIVLDGPPIFLYDENNKQTRIQSCETDNNIFNDETYFNYNSGNKFNVGTNKKNIINLNTYKYLMYEYSSSYANHYCGSLLTNKELSAYEGKTFNVVYEVWTYKRNLDFQPSINTPIKNKDGEYVLTAVSPSQNLNQKIDRIDWETGGGGGTTIKPASTTYTATVTQYKLYSFKLSKTDSTTGVYEYTFTD